MLAGGAALLGGGSASPARAAIGSTDASAIYRPSGGPRARVLFLNDLSGDVDGLFALVHAILSPSIELRGIVGTAATGRQETTANAVSLAREALQLTGRTEIPVHPGAAGPLKDIATPITTPGAQAIVDEARRDSRLPLYVAVGGGLTEVASALMMEPSIASRMTVIWIGGNAYPEGGPGEYNFGVDRLAAQYVFNNSDVPLWQVTSDAYATCSVSVSELQAYVAPAGAVGAWLYAKLIEANKKFAGYGMNTGETWTLGDSPLVLLTALTDWVPSAMGQHPRYERTGSSRFREFNRPLLDARGLYQPRASAATIRAYYALDTRLMFADFFAKLRLRAALR